MQNIYISCRESTEIQMTTTEKDSAKEVSQSGCKQYDNDGAKSNVLESEEPPLSDFKRKRRSRYY